MSDPVYEEFHAWRRLLDTDLTTMEARYLQALAAELRVAASRIDEELRRRQPPSDQHDARLYRQRGQP